VGKSLPVVKQLPFIGGVLAGSRPPAQEKDCLPMVVGYYHTFLSKLGASKMG